MNPGQLSEEPGIALKVMQAVSSGLLESMSLSRFQVSPAVRFGRNPECRRDEDDMFQWIIVLFYAKCLRGDKTVTRPVTLMHFSCGTGYAGPMVVQATTRLGACKAETSYEGLRCRWQSVPRLWQR